MRQLPVFAGRLASSATVNTATALDVVETRLQTEGLLSPVSYRGCGMRLPGCSSIQWAMSRPFYFCLHCSCQVVAGGLAGGTAAGITTPLDVVKTRLQTEGVLSPASHRGSGVLPALKLIAQREGPAALWRGLRPRVVFHMPAAAVCWGTYESMKALLLPGERPPRKPGPEVG